MAKTSTGDCGTWNAEVASLNGRVLRVDETEYRCEEHRSRASMNKTQREITSDRTVAIAAHGEDALTWLVP
ncbi:HVA1 family protein [Citreimonas salinaria]|uniref:Uncharacterized protein n=1 Tax=Citreimonas salinaria TaxID=321339 RepID=A0A1H3NB06_9RHOB|nr:HVA1 family protein [Citreimonas salinaria]SDY86117.1 Protein of unknown function [Citreimonas salinaria]